jgi:hypothetical protein
LPWNLGQLINQYKQSHSCAFLGAKASTSKCHRHECDSTLLYIITNASDSGFTYLGTLGSAKTNVNNLIVIVLPKEPKQVQLSNADIKVTTLLLDIIYQCQ